MDRVSLTPEGVVVRRTLRPTRTLYYEELRAARAEAGSLHLLTHAGHALRVRVGAEAAGSLATELRRILLGTEEALARCSSVAALRQEVTDWLRLPGFSAKPFVDLLLQAAVALDASDLHLEPRTEGGHRILLRIDGVMRPAGTLPQREGARCVGRLKVMAGLLAHRSDIPQEGRAPVGDAWVRLSCVPSVGGESATVRLFDRLKGEARLGDLGLGHQASAGLAALLREPCGVILFAGPSASGKTTTLYTALRSLLEQSGGTLRAVTVEDPVEYRLDGVVQLEVAAAPERDGPTLLRSLLRQDADLVVVGEVRDAQTTDLVLRAGLTGHRVLSTVHAGDCAEALLRLLEQGAAGTVVGSAVRGVVAQRLLRLRCPVCSGAGCAACFQSGYRGRTAVAEVLSVGPELRAALERGAGLEELRAAARASGWQPLRRAADGLAASDVTDPREVERVLGPAPAGEKEAVA